MVRKRRLVWNRLHILVVHIEAGASVFLLLVIVSLVGLALYILQGLRVRSIRR